MKSKIYGMSVAVLALLGASHTASAADMPVKGYRPAVMAYYNWTGLYAGINAGYGFGKSDWSAVPAASVKPKGFLAGGTVGYNWQSGAMVYGIEGDFDWSDVKASATCGALGTCQTSSPWLATFRGRVGYAFDRWLPYITGGGAYGNVKATTSAPGAGIPASASNSQLGWTLGAGLEYAMMGNWTAKIEYLYVDLGSFNSATAPVVNNVSFKENIVRAGLNYKFAGPIFSRF